MKLGFLYVLIAVTIISCKSKSPQDDHIIESSNTERDTDHLILGREIAKQQLTEVLSLYKDAPFSQSGLISDSAMAVAVAEPVLFATYGKEQILSERPYEVYKFDSLWYLSGTIPKGWKGGGFEIIINSNNGRILTLRHYK